MARIPLFFRTTSLVRWLVAALGLVAILYLGVANAVLATSAGRRILSSEHVRVDYRHATSFWPGRASFTGLKMRVGAPSSGWLATLEHVKANVRVWPLLRGRVSARHIEGDRVRLTAGPADQDTIEPRRDAPPSIPLVLARPRATASANIDEPLVAIDELVLTNVEYVGADDLAYHGTAGARGALTIGRNGSVSVRDFHTDILSGDVRVGERAVVQNISGRIDIAALHAEHERPLRSALESFDGGVELASALTSSGNVALSPEGAGVVRISVRAHDGVLVSGSSAEVQLPPIELTGRYGQLGFAGDLGLRITDNDARLSGTLRDVRVSFVVEGEGESESESESRKRTLVAPSVALRGTSRTLHVGTPLTNARLSVEASRLRGPVGAIPFVGSLVTSPDAEIADGSASLRIDDGTFSGSLAIRTHPLRATFGDVSLEGALTSHAELLPWTEGDARMRGRATFALRDSDTVEPVFTLGLESVEVSSRPALALDADVQLDMRSSAQFLRYVTRGAELPGLLGVLASTQRFAGHGRLHAERSVVSLADLTATSGPVHMEGDVISESNRTRAAILLSTGPLAIGIEREADRISFVLSDARRWFETARLEPANEPVGTTSTTSAEPP